MLKNILLVVQVVVSVALIASILVQNKGVGLGRVWGGGSQSSFTRRGLEKLIFKFTFVLVAAFVALSIVQLFL